MQSCRQVMQRFHWAKKVRFNNYAAILLSAECCLAALARAMI